MGRRSEESKHQQTLQEAEAYKSAVYGPEDARNPQKGLKARAIDLYFSGKDPLKVLTEEVGEYLAKLAVHYARIELNEVREARKARLSEIKEQREQFASFTYENFGDNIDQTVGKESGMSVLTIYSIIEVWDENEDVEKQYLVNFSDFRTKEWLIRLMVWGLTNKKDVHVRPSTETDMSTMRMFVPKDKE